MIKQLATLGPIGYFKAPGTCATLATFPLVLLLRYIPIPYGYSVAVLIIFCASVMVVRYALPLFGNKKDPSEIVLDEVVGTVITFLGIPLEHAFWGFLLFRLFDISKPLLVQQLERLPGAWGIIMDDVAAGFLANFCLRFLISYVFIYTT